MVATSAEAGFPTVLSENWYGVLAPYGTPSDTVRRLNSEILKVLEMADVKERLKTQGADPAGNSPDEFQELLRRVSEPIRGTQYFLPLGSTGPAGV